MAGKGGFKHRKRRLDRKRTQRKLKAKANIARVRNQFEKQGQAWDPDSNASQLAALNHDARRLVSQHAFDSI